MAQHPSLKGNPRRTQVTCQQCAMTTHNAILCSLRNLKFSNDRAQTRWMGGYAASKKDTDPALIKIQRLRSSSNIAKSNNVQNPLLLLVQVHNSFQLQFGEAQYRLWLLSTQEYKLNIHFSHFLSNFVFPGPRYDFIFKVKIFQVISP